MPSGHEVLHALASSFAILVAAGIAWLVQHRISIRRATVDFVSAHESENATLRMAQKLVSRFAAQKGHPQGLMGLLNPSCPDEQNQQDLILTMLNHYELVAVAIKERAFSRAIYRRWNRTTYTRAWEHTQSFIQARREQRNQKTAYQNFERLAEKLKKPTLIERLRRAH